MPMLADLDDPPKSRWPAFVVGLVVAAPVAGLLAIGLLPWLYGVMLGTAEAFDARLRQEDAYMGAVCGEHLQLPRDESLCSCVLGAEFPSLDCRPQFLGWTLARQADQCRDPQLAGEAIAFCSCVRSLSEELEKLGDDDAKARRQVEGRYANCTELDDALSLPSADKLSDTAEASPESPSAVTAG